MNGRVVVAVILFIAFFATFFNVITLPLDFWRFSSLGQKVIVSVDVVAFGAMAALSYFVDADFQTHSEEIESLRMRIEQLEKKTNHEATQPSPNNSVRGS